MTNKITIKRSSVPGKVPISDDLDYGEFALNYHDGNLFFKNSTNTVTTLASTQFVTVSGNITGNYFIGNGSLLTGIVATEIGNVPSLTVTGNTNTGNLLTDGNITIYDAAGNYASITAPDLYTSNVVYKLPLSDGQAGNILSTDGTGNLYWRGTSSGAIYVGTRDSGTIIIDTVNGFLNILSRDSGSIPVPVT